MLLQSYGCLQVSRERAEEIATMAKCHAALVYKVAAELKPVTDPARPTSKPTQQSQPPVVQAVSAKPTPAEEPDPQESESTSTSVKPPKHRGMRRHLEMIERDAKIAAMAKEGLSQGAIAERLGVRALTLRELVRDIDRIGHEAVYAELQRRVEAHIPLDADLTGDPDQRR